MLFPNVCTNRISMTVLSKGYVNHNQIQDSLCVYCVVPQLSVLTVRALRSNVGLTQSSLPWVGAFTVSRTTRDCTVHDLSGPMSELRDPTQNESLSAQGGTAWCPVYEMQLTMPTAPQCASTWCSGLY